MDILKKLAGVVAVLALLLGVAPAAPAVAASNPCDFTIKVPQDGMKAWKKLTQHQRAKINKCITYANKHAMSVVILIPTEHSTADSEKWWQVSLVFKFGKCAEYGSPEMRGDKCSWQQNTDYENLTPAHTIRVHGFQNWG